MITQKQYDKIKEMIDRYLTDNRSITANEIRTFAESLTPTSPKTGKAVTFGTMCNYVMGKIPSHCNKVDLLRTLNVIAYNDKSHGRIVPEKRLGFFDA